MGVFTHQYSGGSYEWCGVLREVLNTAKITHSVARPYLHGARIVLTLSHSSTKNENR